MRALVQRVREARVEIDGAVVGAIGSGLLVYVGFTTGDGAAQRTALVDKITSLRVFENEAGKPDKSVVDVGGQLLVVSQFTLYGDTSRGRRPSFDRAMPPAAAEAEYEAFVEAARARVPTATGRFRSTMHVVSTNDGPFTLWLDTDR